MGFNLKHRRDSDYHPMLFSALPWFLEYNKSRDIFVLSDQGGFIPDHEELLSIIQEFCNLYDVLSEDEVQGHNNSRRKTYNIEPEKNSPSPKPTRKPLKGFVYLIKHGDSDFHKIGLSIDPSKRLEQLQGANPEPLKIVSTIATDDMVALEAYFHSFFGDYRHNREWFRLNENQVQQFVNYVNEPDVDDFDFDDDDFFNLEVTGSNHERV